MHGINRHIPIDEENFRIVVTTKRLLRLATEARVLQADTTYKLNWHGFPVLIVGFSDANRVFHPIAMATTTKEESYDFQFIFYSIQLGRQNNFTRISECFFTS